MKRTVVVSGYDPMVKKGVDQAQRLLATSIGIATRAGTERPNPAGLSAAFQSMIQVAASNGMKNTDLIEAMGGALAYLLFPFSLAQRVEIWRRLELNSMEQANELTRSEAQGEGRA